eukprot:3481192-Pleurochrysis_carterae.AAC.2
MDASGGLAFQTLESVAAELAAETASLQKLPLHAFSSASHPVRLNVQLDVARRRTRQFVAVGVKNPQLNSQSCFSLRLLALGTRMKDARTGAQQLLCSNLPFIEHLLAQHIVPVGPDRIPVHFELFFTGDFAGVRAIENAICGCPPDTMHTVPAAEAIATISALRQTCNLCDCRASVEQRTIRAHEPVNGKVLACDCCAFGHNRETADDERAAFVAKLQALRAGCDTAAGKRDLSALISFYKRKHCGTNPGATGVPLVSVGLDRWIVDLLHTDLNHGKLVWKWALTRRLP